jgi:hypothetical protein
LGFEVQSQRIKEKIKISTHVRQALSFDLKVSATRPSTNRLWFELQLQRMKRKIKFSTHVSQALGSDINKRNEVWSSITKNEKKNQNLNPCEPSLGLRYQQTA